MINKYIKTLKYFLLTVGFIVYYQSVLSQPIKVVFTGGPSTGKTTLVNALAKMGYCTVAEAATIVIQEELKQGNDQPWVNMNRFQLDIMTKGLEFFNRGMEFANRAPAGSIAGKFIFFDRAIPDGLAYFEFSQLEAPKEIIQLSQDIRYNVIFVPDFLETYENRIGRREKYDDALKIHNLLIGVYERLGYRVVTIPASTVEARVEFVLRTLESR